MQCDRGWRSGAPIWVSLQSLNCSGGTAITNGAVHLAGLVFLLSLNLLWRAVRGRVYLQSLNLSNANDWAPLAKLEIFLLYSRLPRTNAPQLEVCWGRNQGLIVEKACGLGRGIADFSLTSERPLHFTTNERPLHFI